MNILQRTATPATSLGEAMGRFFLEHRSEFRPMGGIVMPAIGIKFLKHSYPQQFLGVRIRKAYNLGENPRGFIYDDRK